MLKVGILLLSGWLAAGTAAMAAAIETRFSQTVSPEERTALGIDRLTSDQIAILDALVRRDMIERALNEPPAGVPAAFSGRLTDDERKNTGLAALSAEARQQLDAAVARHQAGTVSRPLLEPPVFLRHASAARITEKKKEREIHGSMTLSYGWGGGGYSTRSGSIVMNMTDPDKKYSVTIAYGETHASGPAVYASPGARYPGDPVYLRP